MRKQINLAKAKAMPLTPGLQEFYSRISRRADHFTTPVAPDDRAEEMSHDLELGTT